ncbi:DUF3817 domain-containing protein [Corynebacterium diphtheriae]|uniref:Membrane protein n=2 Tax=Corynebacterium diphtheriae TaxID=1717 RepID=Q6NFN8_CORDI|nr:DUF3817 domain-containing protein [Corynebacterium diphtheriae]ARB87940.1 DUF3817 domain-containing protein [Corynebacterium diphtheriae]KKA80659.1 membrane protein [Corynebacterium diphtheriae]MBG9228556.1 DUF3817 domain-containing protein [Corynebacterium diphtheriae bv. gravis]MBG9251310.1 DUF3817 domain-containing protein [Corynebacterium diphtheriae bv. mitis]MBG9255507.1 DUF3817 domain-containing protein [Corynebacterium diphtheriae bv. mitis]
MTTPTIHPERKRRVAQALRYFSIAAWATGVMLLVLVVRMVCQYGFEMEIPEWAKYIAQVHGLFYIVYLITSLNLGTKARWSPVKWLVTALGGVVPFLSFFVEHWRRKDVTETFQLDRD